MPLTRHYEKTGKAGRRPAGTAFGFSRLCDCSRISYADPLCQTSEGQPNLPWSGKQFPIPTRTPCSRRSPCCSTGGPHYPQERIWLNVTKS